MHHFSSFSYWKMVYFMGILGSHHFLRHFSDTLAASALSRRRTAANLAAAFEWCHWAMIVGRYLRFTGDLRWFNGDLWGFNGDLWGFNGDLWGFNGDLWEFIGDIMGFTIWLWLTVCHGKIHHAINNGKPSISMGHGFHGELLNNQRVTGLKQLWRNNVFFMKEIKYEFIYLLFSEHRGHMGIPSNTKCQTWSDSWSLDDLKRNSWIDAHWHELWSVAELCIEYRQLYVLLDDLLDMEVWNHGFSPSKSLKAIPWFYFQLEHMIGRSTLTNAKNIRAYKRRVFSYKFMFLFPGPCVHICLYPPPKCIPSGLNIDKFRHESGYTYMAVWVGGLEVWEIRVMCKIDFKKGICFVFVFCICFVFCLTNLI